MMKLHEIAPVYKSYITETIVSQGTTQDGDEFELMSHQDSRKPEDIYMSVVQTKKKGAAITNHMDMGPAAKMKQYWKDLVSHKHLQVSN